MTLSLQEISDRLEIQDLLVRYSHSIDTRDFAALDRVFTSDAFIDYTAMGGAKGNLAETKEFLAKAMKMFPSSQHMLGNTMIDFDIDGDSDRARARTMCHNPMVLAQGSGTHVFFCGLWYIDELVRTAEGWRIRQRVEECSYFHNLPEGFEPVS